MIHGKTVHKKRTFTRLVVVAVLVCVVAFAAAMFYHAADYQSREQAAYSVRAAVMNAALQCAAVEGGFPSSLEYLEEHYGLVINHNSYVVTYEAFASNVPPTVVVVPR